MTEKKKCEQEWRESYLFRVKRQWDSVGRSGPSLAWKNWRREEVPIDPLHLHILQFGLLPEWKGLRFPHLWRESLFDFQERITLLTAQTKSLCLSWCVENNRSWLCLPFHPSFFKRMFLFSVMFFAWLDAPRLIFQIVLFCLQLAFLS